MTLDNFLNSTLGKTNIGFGILGECVAYVNLYTDNVFGVRYPITGLSYAGQFLDKPNTRPDLFTQVRGASGIQRGDIVVFGGNPGHVGIFLEHVSGGFISQDQNWTPKTVTRVNHNWSNVIGYIKVKGDEMSQAQVDEIWAKMHEINVNVNARIDSERNDENIDIARLDARVDQLRADTQIERDVDRQEQQTGDNILTARLDALSNHTHPTPEAKPEFDEPTKSMLQTISDFIRKILNK